MRPLMVNVSVARRYARALIHLVGDGAGLERVQLQLSALASAVGQIPELKELVVNPAYSRSERITALESVMNALGGSEPQVMNFLRLLVERDRIALLPDIARLFRDMADAIAGRLRGRVTSAVPLPEEAVQNLTRALERVTQRRVELESDVDPSLLGGLTARVGSTVYDASLRQQLEQLRRALKEG
jgi:F-type H+-transporting ATPase subunit delta